ncbi:PAS domain S-box protein [Microcella sp.]|uniref:PAS domain S-box protein n=1 Tax=Microcella sp. TaxID=1913979 RepID=UPI00391D6EEF
MSESTAAVLTLDDVVRVLRITAHDSPDSIFVLDREGVFLMANETLCAALRVDECTLIGHRFELSARSTDPERILEAFRSARSGTAARYRGSGTRSDGEPFVAEVTQVPIRLDGEVVAVLGTAVDITASDRDDAEARQGEDLLRLAGRLARFGGWSVDASTRQVSLSKDARTMLGLPDDTPDLTAAAWALHPDDERERVAGELERCLATGDSFDIESTMITTSGERLTIRTVGEAVVDAQGVVIAARGAICDISDTVSARERERELEARLAGTLNAITDGIFFLDHEWTITYVNERGAEMSRSTVDAMVGAVIWQLFPAAADAGFRSSFEQAIQSRERVVHRALFVPFGRWFESTAYPTERGVAVYFRDVTDEEAIRAEALASQRKIAQQAALLDSASDAMIVRDLDNRVQYWNAAATRLYGWTAAEAEGQWVGDLIYADLGVLEHATEQVLRDGYFADEVEQRDKNGRSVVVDCRWQLLTDDDGAPRAIFAINTDITEYRAEQEARQRAQRLESLGTLAGGIAHDLNNVLTPILMSVQLLESDETDPERAEMLASMETAVKRGAEMVRQVLSFARGVEGRRIAVDVDRLLDDLLAFARDALPRGVTLDVDRVAPLPGTIGDPTQLLQVLINLVTNAKDAMGTSGRLRISAEVLDIVDEYTSVSHAAAAGSYIAIAVEDDGHGMPAEVAAKIFEPFFTTKSPGRGTGLGLATSLSIMRSHGGFMQVYSEPEHGTRFIMGLPVAADGAAGQPAAPASRSAMPRGEGELVLVIDDEETIRTVTSRTLEVHGYRTLTAANGREAIDIIEHGGERVDLVLTDMMMPVMDGAATSAYLEEHHPSIPIIAASGLNSGGSGERSVGMGIARFIAKPYTTSLLLTTVRDTLLEHRSTDQEGS